MKRFNEENKENKENGNVIMLTKKNKIIIALDKDKDGFVSLGEFMALSESLGPNEKPGGFFTYYHSKNFAENFLHLLIKMNHPIISKIVCIPNLNYCIYVKPNTNLKETVTYVSQGPICSNIPGFRNFYTKPIKSNILFFNPPEHSKKFKKEHGFNNYNLVIPDSLITNLNSCDKINKYIVFLNLFLITITDNGFEYSHSNIIIINLLQKTVERFDPHGGSTFIQDGKNIKNLKKIYKQELIDEVLRDKFNKILPNYKYLDLSTVCPYLGPQVKIDAFNGICVTWSLMYFLLRVLNPSIMPEYVIKNMMSGTHKEVLSKVLKFQRYVIDYLRDYPFDKFENLKLS